MRQPAFHRGTKTFLYVLFSAASGCSFRSVAAAELRPVGDDKRKKRTCFTPPSMVRCTPVKPAVELASHPHKPRSAERSVVGTARRYLLGHFVLPDNPITVSRFSPSHPALPASNQICACVRLQGHRPPPGQVRTGRRDHAGGVQRHP